MNFSVMRFPGNSRNITETSQVFMGHDPHTKTHSGVRIVLGYPNQDTWEDIGHRINSIFTLRGNEGRESSGDRGVNHIHHTSINPYTALNSVLTTDSTSNNEGNYEGLCTEESTLRCTDADNSVFV